MEFKYFKQPPRKYTFEMPQVRKWVEYQCEGAVLNLFAGPTKLSIDEVRVDADQKMPADYHMDCREFVEYATSQKIKFDTVILDPPYAYRKSKEMYNGNMVGQLPRLKNELSWILSKQAKILQFGYDTVGMGAGRGFEKIGFALICHGGDSKDTLCVVEKKIK